MLESERQLRVRVPPGAIMKFVKKRKPRGLKKDGHRSYDLCTCCFHPQCDPMFGRPPKVTERLIAGVCLGCGRSPCVCKSSKTLSKIGKIVGK